MNYCLIACNLLLT